MSQYEIKLSLESSALDNAANVFKDLPNTPGSLKPGDSAVDLSGTDNFRTIGQQINKSINDQTAVLRLLANAAKQQTSTRNQLPTNTSGSINGFSFNPVESIKAININLTALESNLKTAANSLASNTSSNIDITSELNAAVGIFIGKAVEKVEKSIDNIDVSGLDKLARQIKELTDASANLDTSTLDFSTNIQSLGRTIRASLNLLETDLSTEFDTIDIKGSFTRLSSQIEALGDSKNLTVLSQSIDNLFGQLASKLPKANIGRQAATGIYTTDNVQERATLRDRFNPGNISISTFGTRQKLTPNPAEITTTRPSDIAKYQAQLNQELANLTSQITKLTAVAQSDTRIAKSLEVFNTKLDKFAKAELSSRDEVSKQFPGEVRQLLIESLAENNVGFKTQQPIRFNQENIDNAPLQTESGVNQLLLTAQAFLSSISSEPSNTESDPSFFNKLSAAIVSTKEPIRQVATDIVDSNAVSKLNNVLQDGATSLAAVYRAASKFEKENVPGIGLVKPVIQGIAGSAGLSLLGFGDVITTALSPLTSALDASAAAQVAAAGGLTDISGNIAAGSALLGANVAKAIIPALAIGIGGGLGSNALATAADNRADTGKSANSKSNNNQSVPTDPGIKRLQQLVGRAAVSGTDKDLTRARAFAEGFKGTDQEQKAQRLISSLEKTSLAVAQVLNPVQKFTAALKDSEAQLKQGNFVAAKSALTRAQDVVKSTTLPLDRKFGNQLTNLEIGINDAELKSKVKEISNEIKSIALNPELNSQLDSIPGKISALNSFQGSETGVLALTKQLQQLNNSLSSDKAKEFTQQVKTAELQTKSGKFTDAAASIDKASSLSSSDLNKEIVSKLTVELESAKLKAEVQTVIDSINEVRIQGATPESIQQLKTLASAFNQFTDQALLLKKEITKLEKSLPKVAAPLTFAQQSKSINSDIRAGNLDRATTKLQAIKPDTDNADQSKEIENLSKRLESKKIAQEAGRISVEINALKNSGATADQVRDLQNQVSQLPKSKERNTLQSSLNVLDKQTSPKDVPFSTFLSALKTEKSLGQKTSAEDIVILQSKVSNRSQQASVDKFLTPAASKPIDNFKIKLEEITAKRQAKTLTQSDIDELRPLASSSTQLAKLQRAVNDLAALDLARAFEGFKKAATDLQSTALTAEEKFVNIQSLNKFRDTKFESQAGKIEAAFQPVVAKSSQLSDFNKVIDSIKLDQELGLRVSQDKFNTANDLAGSDKDKTKLSKLTKKEQGLINEDNITKLEVALSTLTDGVVVTDSTVLALASSLRGTNKESLANKLITEKSTAGLRTFAEELSIQKDNLSRGKGVDTRRLTSLAQTDTQKIALSNFNDQRDAQPISKDLAALKTAIKDVNLGLVSLADSGIDRLSVRLNNAGLGKEVKRQTSKLIDQEEKAFNKAKSTLDIQFITQLAAGTTKFAAAAKEFLNTQSTSNSISEFRKQIAELDNQLKKGEISAKDAVEQLSTIQTNVSNSGVDNQVLNNSLATKQRSFNRAADAEADKPFQDAKRLETSGDFTKALAAYKSISEGSSKVADVANQAFKRLSRALEELNPDQKLQKKKLTAEFDLAKSEFKTTGNNSGLEQIVKKLSSIPTSGNELFDNGISKLLNDAKLALNKSKTTSEESTGNRFQFTELQSTFQILVGGARSAYDSLKALATAASVTGVVLDRLNLANTGISGQTNSDISFATSEAARTGQSQTDVLTGLASLKLSATPTTLDEQGNIKAQSIDAKDLQTISKGISSAATALQLSGEAKAGFDNVAVQILSKGQVQSEEIKRQLSNFLPGAVGLFAQSQGITGKELESRLKTGSVEASSFTDFANFLETKFGSQAAKDTPVKAFNTLESNIKEIGIRAATPLSGVISGGLSPVNATLSGLKESAGTLSLAGILGVAGVGTALTSSIIEAVSKSEGVLKKTFDAVKSTLLSNTDLGLKPSNLTAIGKATGLVLGAGILTSVSQVVFKGDGLDKQFEKFAKNVSKIIPQFDKSQTSVEKPVTNLLADTFTQIIPTIGLLSGALQVAGAGAKSVKEARKEKRFEGLSELDAANLRKADLDNKPQGLKAKAGAALSGGLDLLGGPIVALASLTAALGIYAISQTKFESEFSATAKENIKAINDNTRAINIKAGNKPTGKIAPESTDAGAFGINNQRRLEYDNAAIFAAKIQGRNDKLGRVTARGIDQEIVKTQQEIDKGDTSSKTAEFLKALKAEQAKIKNGESREFDRADGATKFNTDSVQTLGSLFDSLAVGIQATDTAILNFKDKTNSAGESLATVKSRISSNESKIAEIDSRRFVSTEQERLNSKERSGIETQLENDRRFARDNESAPLKAKAAAINDAILKGNQAIDDLIIEAEALQPGSAARLNKSVEIKQRRADIEKLQTIDLPAAKKALNEVDPSAKLAAANSAAESLVRRRELETAERSAATSRVEGRDIGQRLGETNDRSANVRKADLALSTAKEDSIATNARLEDALRLQAELSRGDLGEEGLKKRQDNELKIFQLRAENEKNITAVANAELDRRFAIEARLIEEADRLRTKQDRSLAINTSNLNANNTVDASAQFNINSARNNEQAARASENLGNTQIQNQRQVVSRTTVGREAQQDKLEELQATQAERRANRVQATRARREAEEQRSIELADIRSQRRAREVTNTTSLNSRIQRTFSAGDGVIDAGLNLKSAQLNSNAARVDVEKQIALLSTVRIDREKQLVRLEELKSTKLQKDTDLYLSKLAKVRAEYELLTTVLANITAAKNAANDNSTTVSNRVIDAQTGRLSAPILSSSGVNTGLNSKDAELNAARLKDKVANTNDFSRLLNEGNDFVTKNNALKQKSISQSDLQKVFNSSSRQIDSAIIANTRRLSDAQRNPKADPNLAQGIENGIKFLNVARDIAIGRESRKAELVQLGQANRNESINRSNTRNLETRSINDSANIANAQKADRKAEEDRGFLTQASRFAKLGQQGISVNLEKTSEQLANDIRTAIESKRTKDRGGIRETQLAINEQLETRKQVIGSSSLDEVSKSREVAEIDKKIAALKKQNLAQQEDIPLTGLKNLLDTVIGEIENILTSEPKANALRDEAKSKSREQRDLQLSFGTKKESQESIASTDIKNRASDFNESLRRSITTLGKTTDPGTISKTFTSLLETFKGNSKAINILNNAKGQFDRLATSGKLDNKVLIETINSLKSLGISADEVAEALKLSAESIARNRDIESTTNTNNLIDTNDELNRAKKAGRFSGVLNDGDRRDDFQSQISKINRDAELRRKQVLAEQADNKEQLTPEQSQAKFGTRLAQIDLEKELKLTQLISPARALGGELSDIIANGLSISKSLREGFESGDWGKVGSDVARNILTGLADYFGNKAQKQIQDALGSFFEQLIDGILGKAKESITKGNDTAKTIADALLPKPSITAKTDADGVFPKAMTNAVMDNDFKPYPSPSSLGDLRTPTDPPPRPPTAEESDTPTPIEKNPVIKSIQQDTSTLIEDRANIPEPLGTFPLKPLAEAEFVRPSVELPGITGSELNPPSLDYEYSRPFNNLADVIKESDLYPSSNNTALSVSGDIEADTSKDGQFKDLRGKDAEISVSQPSEAPDSLTRMDLSKVPELPDNRGNTPILTEQDISKIPTLGESTVVENTAAVNGLTSAITKGLQGSNLSEDAAFNSASRERNSEEVISYPRPSTIPYDSDIKPYPQPSTVPYTPSKIGERFQLKYPGNFQGQLERNKNRTTAEAIKARDEEYGLNTMKGGSFKFKTKTNESAESLDGLTAAADILTESFLASQPALGSFIDTLLKTAGADSGGLGGSIFSALGSLFNNGGGGESEVGSAVFNALPSLYDGEIKPGTMFPTTGDNDPRERGKESRVAVINRDELVVPSYMARDFMAFSQMNSNERIQSDTQQINNSGGNTTNYSTSNTSINIKGDTFGRSADANLVINDRVERGRARFRRN